MCFKTSAKVIWQKATSLWTTIWGKGRW